MTDSDLTTRPVRWGILGAGGIASSLAADISRTDGHVVAAVAARDADRAAEFARRYDAPRSFGSYDELYADDEVDVVYVATTHPFHREQALAAIEAGKPVLVEKPLTLDADGAREVFAAAAQAGVFAMEAMWMRTNPLVRQALDLVAGGELGEVRAVQADFAFALDYDPGHRLLDRDNGGGALLDLGIYPATFAWLFLGAPDRVQVSGDLAPTGVDRTVAMQWSRERRGHRPAVQLLGRHDVMPGHRLRDTGLAEPGADLLHPHHDAGEHRRRGPPGRDRAGRLRAADRGGRALPAGRPAGEPAGAAGRDRGDPRADGRRPRRAGRHLPGRVSAAGAAGPAQDRGALRGRGWQRGQENDERFMNASRRIGVPQRRTAGPPARRRAATGRSSRYAPLTLT